MAKIGNEAKLILKLARERMERKREAWQNSDTDSHSSSNLPNWITGYVQCLHDFNGTIQEVVDELEAK